MQVPLEHVRELCGSQEHVAPHPGLDLALAQMPVERLDVLEEELRRQHLLAGPEHLLAGVLVVPGDLVVADEHRARQEDLDDLVERRQHDLVGPGVRRVVGALVVHDLRIFVGQELLLVGQQLDLGDDLHAAAPGVLEQVPDLLTAELAFVIEPGKRLEVHAVGDAHDQQVESGPARQADQFLDPVHAQAAQVGEVQRPDLQLRPVDPFPGLGRAPGEHDLQGDHPVERPGFVGADHPGPVLVDPQPVGLGMGQLPADLLGHLAGRELGEQPDFDGQARGLLLRRGCERRRGRWVALLDGRTESRLGAPRRQPGAPAQERRGHEEANRRTASDGGVLHCVPP